MVVLGRLNIASSAKEVSESSFMQGLSEPRSSKDKHGDFVQRLSEPRSSKDKHGDLCRG